MITQPDSIPDHLCRFDAKIDGPLWLEMIDALPKKLAEPLMASVKLSEPSTSAIKQHVANGGGQGSFRLNADTICGSNSGNERVNQPGAAYFRDSAQQSNFPLPTTLPEHTWESDRILNER